MITLIKRFYAWIFGTKPEIKKEVIDPSPFAEFKAELEKQMAKEVPKTVVPKVPEPEKPMKAVPDVQRRWSIPNNRLHIQYNASCRNFRMLNSIESMRCTSLERAKDIARGIQSYCVRKIVFADASGNQFVIKEF